MACERSHARENIFLRILNLCKLYVIYGFITKQGPKYLSFFIKMSATIVVRQRKLFRLETLKQPFKDMNLQA